MIKELNQINIKQLGKAVVETFKLKPLGSTLKVAAIVTTLALAILLGVFLGPLAPLPLVIALAAISLLLPSLLTGLYYQDIRDVLFSQFKKNHSIDQAFDKEVVLVLEAKHDHNRAFQQDQRNDFRKLEKKYALVYEKVSNIEDISETMNQVLMHNNRIKALWLRAHGSPQGLQLDAHNYLHLANVFLLKHHFNQIDPEGYIILDSCSTADKNTTGPLNIAEKIARYARGRKVIASSQPTTALSLRMGNKKDPLNIRMWTERKSSKHRLWKYPSTALNVFKYLIFTLTKGKGPFKKLAFDATQVHCFKADHIV